MASEKRRPLAKFPSDVWGHYFVSFSLPHSEFESYGKQVEELKGKVMDMLLMDSTSNNPIEKIVLIDSLCRLGILYHFESEIEDILKHIFNDHALMKNFGFGDDYDLYIVALVFRVFRQHGYRISCNIFNKFKDCDGKFKESITRDVKGMLSLFEATHLRVHEEDILDDALVFTTNNLKSIAHDHPLAKQVFHALVHPLHKGMPRLEARRHISLYQQEESRNETLLKLAVLDFNRLQLLHQHELGLISRWWKEFNFAKKLSYTRQRIVELYFWMFGVYFEPQYSSARIILTKVIAMLLILDDTYDAYGTLEELQSLTDAIQMWDANVVNQLPDYMKIIFNALLNTYEEIENDLSKEGRAYAANYSKKAMKETAMAYFIEAKWLNEDHFPKFDEYLKNSLITAGCKCLAVSAVVGMGEIAGRDALEWMESSPICIKSCQAIGRLLNDIVGHKVEQERKHVASAVECYMTQYGVSEEDAVEKIRGMIENAWKDLNEECLSPTAVSMQLLMRVLNLTHTMEVVYKFDDGFTNSATYVKDYITSLFVDPIPIPE
uniref:Terpene synthase n=1 Tax=Pelargonium graveolens TaxID=73200 RepID=A0A7I6JX36_9ROSI|nr:terpene synthase [Pelargonium graveolens]